MPADANELQQQFIESLGVKLPGWAELEEQLTASFRAGDGGYGFLRPLPFATRAVVSDQVLGAARAVETNLVEATIHERDYALLAEGGVPLSTSLADSEREFRLGALSVATVRGLVSALDCAAAVSVALMRIPSSVRRASFYAVLDLNPQNAANAAQRRAWEKVSSLVSNPEIGPPGWLRWMLEIRNAFLHRGRHLQIRVAREMVESPLVLPPNVKRDVTLDRLRGDAHFPQRPWLVDMEYMSDASTEIETAVLNEPVTMTLHGLADSTQRLVEALAQEYLHDFEKLAALPTPAAPTWTPEAPKEIGFIGYAPETLPRGPAMMISPRDAERVRLAAIIRSGRVPD